MVGVLASLVVLNFQGSNTLSAPPLKSIPAPEKKRPDIAPVTEPEPLQNIARPEPRFDFYQVLEEKEAKAREAVRQRIAEQRPRKLTASNLFVVELGSQYTQVDREKIRAQLAMMGYAPEIELLDPDTETYRLFVGPFASEVAAMDMQMALTEQGINDGLVVQYNAAESGNP